MDDFSVYEEFAARTGGEIYLGVVGPVRTGKSTFIKKFMELVVLPDVQGAKAQRMRDELPQSASGKTVMTTEPKFIPEEGAELRAGDATAKVRLVDCVGFPVEGASGFEEEGEARLVHTPWSEQPLPFAEAAEEGTRRVIRDHSTIGILVTADGSFTGLQRAAYEVAEARAAQELKDIGKPYIILYNCVHPERASDTTEQLSKRYGVPVIAIDIENTTREELLHVLTRALYEFPVLAVDIDLPDWMRVLDADSPLIREVLSALRAVAPSICKLSDCALFDGLFAESSRLLPPEERSLDPARGVAHLSIAAKDGAFYEVLSEQCGAEIRDDFSLMGYMAQLREAKKLADRLSSAFHEAEETGYGIVMPDRAEMKLKEPLLVRRGGRAGVHLHADAPSYHIVRVDLSAEAYPTIGSDEQCENFVQELTEQMVSDPEAAWGTNMFGRTLQDMLAEELGIKSRSMGENMRRKMRRTLTRITNEGKAGLICILI